MELNVDYLDELITSKGIKRSFIADKMGITPGSFYNKSKGITEFTFREATILFDVLDVDVTQQKKIFVEK